MTDKEQPFDQWNRFRKAYEKALKDRGFQNIRTESLPEMESHGSHDTKSENVDVATHPSDKGQNIGIMSNPRNYRIRFSELAKARTSTSTVRRKPTASVAVWFCVACSAENPSKGSDGGKVLFCQKCETPIDAHMISEAARKIFGEP